MMRVALALLFATAAVAAQQPGQQPVQRPEEHGRLFPPQDLGLLDSPDRDFWQHPELVMDALAIAENSVVADIGAGSGWFTIHLARRVGPNGKVYAEDVQSEMLSAISRRVQRMNLQNVEPVKGEEANPNLPLGALDAILICDAYHEFGKLRVPMLKALARSLKPDGRIGIIDFKLEGGGPGPPTVERVSPEIVVQDAASAGLRLKSQETFLPYQYFLIFELNSTTRANRGPASAKAPAKPRSPRTP